MWGSKLCTAVVALTLAAYLLPPGKACLFNESTFSALRLLRQPHIGTVQAVAFLRTSLDWGCPGHGCALQNAVHMQHRVADVALWAQRWEAFMQLRVWDCWRRYFRYRGVVPVPPFLEPGKHYVFVHMPHAVRA